ncbi:hypothetical protein K5I04_04795 [Murdochiella sp. Marseille-P8839]|nr:hypothetical protein [Murdochiella sp. Marseille-P8839]
MSDMGYEKAWKDLKTEMNSNAIDCATAYYSTMSDETCRYNASVKLMVISEILNKMKDFEKEMTTVGEKE